MTATVLSPEPSSPLDIYNEALALGGSLQQAQIAAALGNGIESGIGGGYGHPQSTELAGGIGPAEGLFQFEPGTWTGGGKGGAGNGFAATSNVGDASWQQQVQAFLNATSGGYYGDWGPDLGYSGYGAQGGPLPGSEVASMITKEGYTSGTATPSTTPTAPDGSTVAPTPTATTTAIGGSLNPANWPGEFISAIGPYVARIILIIVALILLKVGVEKLLDTGSSPATIITQAPQSVGAAPSASSRGMAGPGAGSHRVEHAAEDSAAVAA